MNRSVLSLVALALLTFWPASAEPAIAPDPTLTPGAIRTVDVADVCSHGTAQLRHMPRERSDRILVEYGLPPGPHPDVEIDHLIPLGIGGADDDKNLWPEPRMTIEPKWNAERKDELEWNLRELVCAGKLDITAAQQAVADDWIEAWTLFVGPAAVFGE
jgi:hypothetical protein